MWENVEEGPVNRPVITGGNKIEGAILKLAASIVENITVVFRKRGVSIEARLATAEKVTVGLAPGLAWEHRYGLKWSA